VHNRDAQQLEGLAPADVIDTWPVDEPLAALCSARAGAGEGAGGGAWARWSILARPAESLVVRASDVAGRDAIDLCERALKRHGTSPLEHVSEIAGDTPPFLGGWILALSYDLGRCIEPAATIGRHAMEPRTPLIVLHRCPAAYGGSSAMNPRRGRCLG
jgi:hypothetical protein